MITLWSIITLVLSGFCGALCYKFGFEDGKRTKREACADCPFAEPVTVDTIAEDLRSAVQERLFPEKGKPH